MFLEKGMITRIRQRRGMMHHAPTNITIFTFFLCVLCVLCGSTGFRKLYAGLLCVALYMFLEKATA
jgi:hypothetical protein